MEEALPYKYQYPHPAVAADCLVFGYDGNSLKILLIRRKNDPYKGYWAVPGGFSNMDETIDETAKRELREETGLEGSDVELYGVFSKPDRDPRERVIGITYLTIIRLRDAVGGDDAEKAQWFDINDLPELAFDHAQSVELAKQHLKELNKLREPQFNADTEMFSPAEMLHLRLLIEEM